MKSKPATIGLHVRVRIAIFCISFTETNRLYIIIYKQNNSLRTSTGPSVAFNSIELHEQKVNIKTYWAAAMWLTWWWPSGPKPCQMIHCLWIFKKRYTWSCRDWWTIGNDSKVSLLKCLVLKNWCRKVGLCLHLEIVDVCSRFGLDCIKMYVNCISAQVFINCTSNTIP